MANTKLEFSEFRDMVPLYREWLIRMTGMAFSESEAEEELKTEIENGNEEAVRSRIGDVVLLKSNRLCSKTWEDVLLEDEM